jgi:hypothetical protein
MRFDGFTLIWYDSPYPSTRVVGHWTRAQSGQTIIVKRLGIEVGAHPRPFTDSKESGEGPIPEGHYDIYFNDAGHPTLRRAYGVERDENGIVVNAYRWTNGVRGMQCIPDDVPLYVDNPKTPDVDESNRQVDVWGRYRARIIPRVGTRTFGRGGFYLHSSNKLGGTHGCIETMGNEYIFLRLAHVRTTLGVHKILLVVKSVAADMFSDEIRALRP